MMKVPKEKDEGAELKERGVTFSQMIRTEIRVERWMKRGWYPSSEEVTPSDIILEMSTVNYLFMIEEDEVILWNIIYYIVVILIDCMYDGISKERWGM